MLRRSLNLQTLEERRVLAAAVFDGGTLTVHAGDADNEIGVWVNRETNKLFIKVDDTTLEFDNDLVSHINIYAEGATIQSPFATVSRRRPCSTVEMVTIAS